MSFYCGRKTVNWSDVNSEKATKTEALLMNCGRGFENQDKAADSLRRCCQMRSEVPLNKIPVISSEVKVK